MIVTRRNPPTSLSRWLRPLAVLSVLWLSACGGPYIADPLTEPEILRFVTPSVAATIDADGYFFDDDEGDDPKDISAQRAREVAHDWIDRRRGNGYGPLAWARGGHVDFDQLVVCGRLHYAASPYGHIEDFHGRAHDYLSGFWIVTLCAKGAEQVVLWVSARDLAEFVPGHVPFVRPAAIKEGENLSQFLVAPEDVVRTIATTTGIRIAGRPKLFWSPPAEGGVFWLRWKVEVESTVPNLWRTASNAPVTTNSVWLGRIYPDGAGIAGALGVSKEIQPPITPGTISLELRAGVNPHVEPAEVR